MTEIMGASELSRQNDAFRQALGSHGKFRGRMVGTPAVSALPAEALNMLLEAVRDFEGFDDDDDPYGDHDFGAVTFAGEKWFWKIDCFENDECEFGAITPEQPEHCFRVLTIMRADEY